MTLARTVLILRVIAAAMLMVAAIWWTRSPRLDGDGAATAPTFIPVDTAPVPLPTAATEETNPVDVIVNNNVFAVTRRPPSIRFQPPRVDTGSGELTSLYTDQSVNTMPVDPAAAMAAAPGASMEPVPALYGTMRTGDGVSALLRLDARRSAPQLYQVGDRAGGFRVVRIDDRTVILSGSSGPVTLRLANPDKDVP